MAVLAFCSAAGSPGVTTTAIGVTQHWPGSAVLMDADCHSAVPTGLLGGQQSVSGGLLRVLEAAQFGRDVRNAVWDQSMPLPGDDPDGIRRLFLPGMPTLPGLRSLEQAWGEVAAGLAQLGPAGVDVIVDLGRITNPAGVHPALIGAISELCLLVRPTLRDVAAARWVAGRIREQCGTTGKARVVVMAAGPHHRGFDDAEVAEALGLPTRTRIPHDPAWAAVWSDGMAPPRRLGRDRTETGDAAKGKGGRGRYRHVVAHLAMSLHDRARVRPEAGFLEGSV
ncbi:MAG TPA: hypothetical protein VK103_00625 [Bacillota bacterium]|nr:hypothetical protein [Bacillota bacterium]